MAKLIIALLFITVYGHAQGINDTTGSKLSAAEAKSVLEQHNVARKEVGVAPLVWSKELAAYAQQWADHLAAEGKMAHRTDHKYGENVFAGTAGAYTSLDAVSSWYGEKNNYKYGKFNGASGHYTQMIWQNSTAVGIGMATGANGMVYIVANYSPTGNYMEEYPYKK